MRMGRKEGEEEGQEKGRRERKAERGRGGEGLRKVVVNEEGR